MAAALIGGFVLRREKADEGVGRGPGGPPHHENQVVFLLLNQVVFLLLNQVGFLLLAGLYR
jgi:hypothetical protein